MIKEEIT